MGDAGCEVDKRSKAEGNTKWGFAKDCNFSRAQRNYDCFRFRDTEQKSLRHER